MNKITKNGVQISIIVYIFCLNNKTLNKYKDLSDKLHIYMFYYKYLVFFIYIIKLNQNKANISDII